MPIPELTAKDCNDVLDQEIQLGQVASYGDNINHKIMYHVKSGIYTVYKNKDVRHISGSQEMALEKYNEMNKKVDHLF